MIRSPIIACLLATASAAAGQTSDLLRFTNGDQLHGEFAGIGAGPTLIWQRPDIRQPARLETQNLRHIVLRGGQPEQSLGTLSQIELVNGDRLPGTITGLSNSSITLDTPYAGTLEIPRNMVTMLAPTRGGGRLYYHGPFSEDGWETAHPYGQEALAEAKPNEGQNPPDQANAPSGGWKHTGASWYSLGEQAGIALIRENSLPERSALRIEVAWRGAPKFAIGLNADFAPIKDEANGKPAEEPPKRSFIPSDVNHFPRIFGNSCVLQINANYMVAYRTSINHDGSPRLDRIRITTNRLKLDEKSKATIEIRSNRDTSSHLLFIDDEYITQWSDSQINSPNAPKLPPLGNGLGFISQSNSCSVRISDIIISEWNGMPDSARSLQTDEHDIALMTNGLDRISGQALEINNDHELVFESKHGKFEIPVEEIAELRFARNRLATQQSPSDQNITVRLSPDGAITGTPISATREELLISHPIAGDLKLSTESAIMLEFNSTKTFIDDWDANF